MNPITKKMEHGSYTEFHLFAPVSPKLMIVLRSVLLPVPEEDANEEVRAWREEHYEQNAAQHTDPLNFRSILEDLPINKARNSYTKIVDGRLVLLEGENGSHRADHKFCFRFFPISAEHTDRINSIMLENAHYISTLVFRSKGAASKTLSEYLTSPCEVNGTPCFKIVDAQDDERLTFLRKLEKVMSDLGSKVTSTYQMMEGKSQDPLQMVGQMLKKCTLNQQDKPTEFMQLYARLGLLVVVTLGNISADVFDRWRSCNVTKGHGSSSQDDQHEDQDRCLVPRSQQGPTRGHSGEAGRTFLQAPRATSLAVPQACKAHAPYGAEGGRTSSARYSAARVISWKRKYRGCCCERQVLQAHDAPKILL